MLNVLTFMKEVADGLQMGGNFGTAHVYRSSLNAIIAYCGGEDFTFNEITPEWLKGFEIHLRKRKCSWNTVSTYMRILRAVYNRAVDNNEAKYIPRLLRLYRNPGGTSTCFGDRGRGKDICRINFIIRSKSGHATRTTLFYSYVPDARYAFR